MNLEGKRFDRLTVRKKIGRGFWECDCDCGKIVNRAARMLLSGSACACADCIMKGVKKPRKEIPVYMKITKDKYELPIVAADTMGELARLCGVSVTTISHCIAKAEKGLIKNSSYICVWIPDDALQEAKA